MRSWTTCPGQAWLGHPTRGHMQHALDKHDRDTKHYQQVLKSYKLTPDHAYPRHVAFNIVEVLQNLPLIF